MMMFVMTTMPTVNIASQGDVSGYLLIAEYFSLPQMRDEMGCAQAGFETVVREISDPLIQKSRGGIEKVLAKGIEKGKVTPEQRDAALSKLTFTTSTCPVSPPQTCS